RPSKARGAGVIRVSPPRRATVTPMLRRQATVAATSSPAGRPAIMLSPSASALRISARCAIDLSPGTRSSPATRVAGSTSSTTPSSTRGMGASPEEIAHPIATVDPLPVIVQHVREPVDRLNQGAAVGGGDVVVEGAITLREANHAAIAGAAKLGISDRPNRLRVCRADGERKVAEKRHLPVVSLGGQDFGTGANRTHQAKPFIERCELLPIAGREDPGLSPEQHGIALAQPAPLLTGDRMAAKEHRLIR